MFTIPDFYKAKKDERPLALLTCYDAWTAASIADSPLDAVLVGDSAAMVVHGMPSTLGATVEIIATHVRAVRAGGGPELCIIADMPFLSTRKGVAAGVEAAGALMQAGANAVKIEGLSGHEELIPQLIGSGIPVMGHLGLQPQSFNLSGGYHVQGGTVETAKALRNDAIGFQKLGCFAIVLECVSADLAATVTKELSIPTIGIGAGSATSGQILVLQDMLGFGKGKRPRFVRPFARGPEYIRTAVADYVSQVRAGTFPLISESYAVSGSARDLPRVISTTTEWKQLCRDLSRTGTIGFVPTMGALHAGHQTLMQQAARENNHALASIFVNPTQFNDPKDLAAYPRTLQADLAILAEADVKAVFVPEPDALYPDKYHYRVTEDQLSVQWEGEFRPGHFNGVLTVVLKLLSLTNATKAYFGEKDYQQLALIRGTAEAFFLDTEIIGVATVREDSGLAMSSRNTRLSAKGRHQAAAFYRILCNAITPQDARAQLEAEGFQVEYVDDHTEPDGKIRRLAALFLEGVRLIDNVSLAGSSQKPPPTQAGDSI